MKNTKRTLLTAGLTGLLLFTAACSNAESAPEASGTATPTTTASATASASASTTVSASATADASPSATVSEAPESPEMKTLREDSLAILKSNGVVPSGETLQNTNGTYPQLVFAEDAKVTAKPAVWEGANPDGWSDADVADANRFFLNYVLQQIIDSPVNGDADQLDDWLEANVNTFREEVRAEIIGDVRAKGIGDPESYLLSTVDTDPSLREYAYSLVYDGKTPRLSTVNVEYSRAQPWEDGAYFEAKFTSVFNAVSDAGIHSHQAAPIVGITVSKGKNGYEIVGIQAGQQIDPPELIHPSQ